MSDEWTKGYAKGVLDGRDRITEREDDYNVFEENCLMEDEAMERYDADAEWRDEDYSDFD